MDVDRVIRIDSAERARSFISTLGVKSLKSDLHKLDARLGALNAKLSALSREAELAEIYDAQSYEDVAPDLLSEEFGAERTFL